MTTTSACPWDSPAVRYRNIEPRLSPGVGGPGPSPAGGLRGTFRQRPFFKAFTCPFGKIVGVFENMTFQKILMHMVEYALIACL